MSSLPKISPPVRNFLGKVFKSFIKKVLSFSNHNHYPSIEEEMNTMFLTSLTLVHVAISLVGIGSGIVVLYGMIAAKRVDSWTAVFLLTTVLTSVTGFFFPADHFTPGHALGILSLLALPIAIFARYRRNLAGAWRPAYVISSVFSLYLNVFVLIVQSFLKIPALTGLAPTQSEPPFLVAQAATLALFLALGAFATFRFRSEGTRHAALV